MRKFIIPIVCTVLLIGICVFADENKAAEEYEGIIRFHVIANSDEPDDQVLKLKVRDELLAKINDELTMEVFAADGGYESIAEGDAELSRNYINNNIGRIKEKALEIVRREGYAYDVEAKLGTCFIPKKTYGEVTFPAGNYEALSITIGKGAGQNWWCVLFPPLCIIDPEGQTLQSAEFTPQDGNKSSITLEFKTKELFENKK
ncbi:MAG: stage II sporulation protein R [Eubacteriales bacterium]|nr:stage II sporulation protein R [Eubacteriales bacterium]MDD4390259.1 stage II sporulation protein R [Eubacteriales bacterium]